MAEDRGKEDSSETGLFTNLKYKLIGQVPDEVVNVLNVGGGEGSTYFSDYVTHCIVGDDPSGEDPSDIGYAKDIYEIPAVNTEWVTLSQKCKKLLPTKPFLVGEDFLFTGLVACLSQISKEDCNLLWAMIKFFGGSSSLTINKKTTHLIVGKAEGTKYEFAMNKEKIGIQLVTPDWITESIIQKTRLPENLYHPRLMIIPQLDRKVTELSNNFSTAHITGFADDDSVSKESPSTPKLSNELLEQLKQRMPWNQPPSSSTIATATTGLTTLPTHNLTNTIVSQEVKEEPKLVTSTPALILQQNQLSQNINQLQNKPHQAVPVLQQQVQPNPQIILQQQRLQQPVQSVPQWRTQASLQQSQLVHQQLQIHQQQQQIIPQQQSSMLLSPQTETQQFIVNQNQISQPRPQQILHQQSKPVIQQQFIVREGTPHLTQSQYVEAKPATQFAWQQQYTQNRQQLIASAQHPPHQPTQQIQQRQVTWMQQSQTQGGGRQLIQMPIDAQTHAQLQQMDPQQRSLFLQRLQKQRQLALQRQLQAQQQNRVVEQSQVQFGVVRTAQPQPQPQPQATIVRGQIPVGMNPQNQLQWIQQQRQNQIVLQQRQVLVQQQQVTAPGGLIRAPGPPQTVQHPRLPVNVVSQASTQNNQQTWQTETALQNVAQGNVPPNQQQLVNMRHQQLQLQRLQQLHLQKQQQQMVVGPQRMPHFVSQNSMTSPNTPTQPSVLLPQHQAEQVDPSPNTEMFTVSNGVQAQQQQQQGLVVNTKTKTALANMLSIRLQSGVSPVTSGDGTASGQLRMMTAQHQASLPPPPPPQPTVPFQRTTLANVNNSATLLRGNDAVTGNSPGMTLSKPAAYAQTAARVAAVLAKSASGTPPANHHHRPQFYGHNPNFKLPTEMFLLGCVFLIMEYDRSGFDVTMWRRIILENGGETELTYSLKVTHILCQTQKHPLVQQGLRDGKRCVTAEWLSDVMLKQQLLPPWLALHFPTPFSDEKPCRNLIICHSGFEGEERVRVKKMIEAVGAKMTSYYSSQTNILVCRRPEGEKYKKAREWGKSVVNVQWLTEVLFGHYSCLQHPENQKYQQFNIGDPFRIDYTLITHLMGAWKVPIQVTQECYERAKSSGVICPRRKRPRIASPVSKLMEVENSIQPEIKISNTFHLPFRPIIIFSGPATIDEEKSVILLGGIITKSYREATHLVMSNIQRTVKFMCCLSTCKYIIHIKWLHDSISSNRFLDEQPYIIDDEEFEKKFSCKVSKVLSYPDRDKLFCGKTFFITPGVTPSRLALTEMIVCAGGIVEKKRKSLKVIQELDLNSYFVITVYSDYLLVVDLIRANIGLFNTEFVMTSIVNQRILYEMAFVKHNSKSKI